jgi:rod shape-determining protein MreC
VLSLIKRYRDLILVAGLLLFPFFTFVTRGPSGRKPMLVDRAVLSVSSYVQGAFGWVLDGTVSVWRGYVALRGVEAENRGLREENQALKMKAQEQAGLIVENERLCALSTYADKHPGLKVVARVVGVDPSSTRHFVRINRGESDGVTAGMAVVTPDGVAGYVERATSGWADVILITDATHRMGVRTERTRARAIAAGTGGKTDLELRLDYALRKDDYQEGDVIVTSGTDGVYPADLQVGTISRVEARGSAMFRAGSIHPAVDPTKLEEVLVLPKVVVPAPASAKDSQVTPGTPGTAGAGVP